ncbi:MAG: tetratricopeptide repeat protein [Promethearchaeota archaeon]
MTNNIEELLEKAMNLVNQEKFTEALEILESLYKSNPNSEEVKNNLIETLFTYGGYLNDEYTLQYQEAKEVFKKIIQIAPNNHRAHYNLGIANFNLEHIEQAKQCYEKALKIKPDYKHCFYNMGLIYEGEGNLQEALNYYEKALGIDPHFIYAVNARNQILTNLERLKEGSNDLHNNKNLEQLKSLLNMSKRIKIEMIQTLLNIEKEKLLELLIDWGVKYQFEIDGDFLIINKETLPDLIKSLGNQD